MKKECVVVEGKYKPIPPSSVGYSWSQTTPATKSTSSREGSVIWAGGISMVLDDFLAKYSWMSNTPTQAKGARF